MGHFNYRVLLNEDNEYEIREVFYDDKNKVKSISCDSSFPYGCTREDLAWELSRMVEALGKPVIREKESI